MTPQKAYEKVVQEALMRKFTQTDEWAIKKFINGEKVHESHKPGGLLNRQPEEVRKALSKLTPDMIKNRRIDILDIL